MLNPDGNLPCNAIAGTSEGVERPLSGAGCAWSATHDAGDEDRHDERQDAARDVDDV